MSLSVLERQMLGWMRGEVARRRAVNSLNESYYDGSFTVKNLGIAVPPSLADIGTVSDWPATVVDVHHERMQFQGWLDGDRTAIGDIFRQTNAALKVSEALLDSMIYGVGFLCIDVDDMGNIRLIPVSPMAGTLLWDYRADRALAGLRTVVNRMGVATEYLMLPGEIVALDEEGEERDRRFFPLLEGEVPMVRLRNRLKPRRFTGQSEITKAVRYYTDAAVRTMLGMEINREFYTTPQRWAMNADMSMFTGSDNPSTDEKVKAGWEATMGRMLALPSPEMGEPEARVGQFTPAPPTPYIEQIRTYSQLLASATGIPSSYLGFSTTNPPSGDAIRAWLERLIRAVEGKQEIANPDLHLLGWMMVRMNGGSVTREEWGRTEEKWRDAATPTKAADADAAVKLVGASILDPKSSVTRDRVGLSPQEQRRMEAESQRGEVSRLVATLRDRRPSDEARQLGERATPADTVEAGTA